MRLPLYTPTRRWIRRLHRSWTEEVEIKDDKTTWSRSLQVDQWQKHGILEGGHELHDHEQTENQYRCVSCESGGLDWHNRMLRQRCNR